jgi:hypothetical protein
MEEVNVLVEYSGSSYGKDASFDVPKRSETMSLAIDAFVVGT